MNIRFRSAVDAILVATLLVGSVAPLLARDAQPVSVKEVTPVYPPDLRRGNIEGSVNVEFIVDENGDVIAARVAEESINERWQFKFSAVVAVWQWKFKPGIKDDKPVQTLLKVPIEFKLQ